MRRPDPLDIDFDRVEDFDSLIDVLRQSEFARNAADLAIARRQEVIAERQRNPRIVGNTPAQICRDAFVEALAYNEDFASTQAGDTISDELD